MEMGGERLKRLRVEMLGAVAGAAITAGCVGTGKTTVEEEAEHSAHVCLDSHRHPVSTKPAV